MSASGRNPPHIEDFIRQRREHYARSPLPAAAIEQLIALEQKALETLETLKDVNGVIAQLYQHEMIAEAEATWAVGALEGFGVPGLTKMESSGNNFDCLIHSFLTATCDNFRRLPQEEKNVFANHFRRVALPALPMIQCFLKKDAVGEINDRRGSPTKGQVRSRAGMMMERIMAPRGFLHETELHLLAAQFEVNILAATAESHLFQPITREALQVLYGDTGCMDRLPPFRRTICIYTSGGHFESVRKAEGYYFTAGDLERFPEISQAAYNARAPKKAEASAKQWACTACTFLNPNTAKACEQCGTAKPSRAEGGQNARGKAEGGTISKALKAIHEKMAAGHNLSAEEVKILETKSPSEPKRNVQAELNAILAKGNPSEANVQRIAELLGQMGGRRTRRRRHKQKRTRRT